MALKDLCPQDHRQQDAEGHDGKGDQSATAGGVSGAAWRVGKSARIKNKNGFTRGTKNNKTSTGRPAEHNRRKGHSTAPVENAKLL